MLITLIPYIVTDDLVLLTNQCVEYRIDEEILLKIVFWKLTERWKYVLYIGMLVLLIDWMLLNHEYVAYFLYFDKHSDSERKVILDLMWLFCISSKD